MNANTTTAEAPAALCTIGRADYEERRAARIDRLHDRAAAHQAAADAAYSRAVAAVDGIPFGQPNIRGCLTPCYKRHDAAMRVSIREQEAADYAAHRAEAAESNRAISSDDPEALEKLREKLAKMEAEREAIKSENKRLRSEGKEANPAWMLSNLARMHPMTLTATKGHMTPAEASAWIEAHDAPGTRFFCGIIHLPSHAGYSQTLPDGQTARAWIAKLTAGTWCYVNASALQP